MKVDNFVLNKSKVHIFDQTLRLDVQQSKKYRNCYFCIVGNFGLGFEKGIKVSISYFSLPKIQLRRAMGDFGVPIAIVVMVTIDLFIKDVYTEKLRVPDGFEVTLPENRTWIIQPLGQLEALEPWMPVAAILPAIMLYTLLFVETHICE